VLSCCRLTGHPVCRPSAYDVRVDHVSYRWPDSVLVVKPSYTEMRQGTSLSPTGGRSRSPSVRPVRPLTGAGTGGANKCLPEVCRVRADWRLKLLTDFRRQYGTQIPVCPGRSRVTSFRSREGLRRLREGVRAAHGSLRSPFAQPETLPLVASRAARRGTCVPLLAALCPSILVAGFTDFCPTVRPPRLDGRSDWYLDGRSDWYLDGWSDWYLDGRSDGGSGSSSGSSSAGLYS
jgi:hypothetical protein